MGSVILFWVGIYFLTGFIITLIATVVDYQSAIADNTGKDMVLLILIWPIFLLFLLTEDIPDRVKSLLLFLAKNIRKNLGMKDDEKEKP